MDSFAARFEPKSIEYCLFLFFFSVTSGACVWMVKLIAGNANDM